MSSSVSRSFCSPLDPIDCLDALDALSSRFSCKTVPVPQRFMSLEWIHASYCFKVSFGFGFDAFVVAPAGACFPPCQTLKLLKLCPLGFSDGKLSVLLWLHHPPIGAWAYFYTRHIRSPSDITNVFQIFNMAVISYMEVPKVSFRWCFIVYDGFALYCKFCVLILTIVCYIFTSCLTLV